MKIKRQNLLCLIVIVISAMAGGCSTTEVVDPPTGTQKEGKAITLTVACPDAAKATRAGNDHVLRYSAIMYTGTEIDETETNPVRQEKLAAAEGATTFTFEVAEGYYKFVLIGDYLPKVDANHDGILEDPQPDENGMYEDKYYDTHSNARIYMRAFWDFRDGHTETIDQTNVNNENFDCFASTLTIEKKVEEERHEIQLDRIVSRISFESNTEMPEGVTIESITLNHFDFFPYFKFEEKTTGDHAYSTTKHPIADFSINSNYSAENPELFYFYTLASQEIVSEGSLYDLYVSVKFSDNSERTTRIKDKTITPQANYKIKVKGPFLSKKLIPSGNIILNLTVDEENWDTDTETEAETK